MPKDSVTERNNYAKEGHTPGVNNMHDMAGGKACRGYAL